MPASISRRNVLLGAGALASTGTLLSTPRTAWGFLNELAAETALSAGAVAAAAGKVRIGDLSVNRMGFGAMRVTGAGIWGPPKDVAEAKRVLRRVVALGVNFIDTADAYGPNVSEELIADALYPYPKGVLIGTKGGQTRPSQGQWVANCRPDHLRAACEASLKRLRVQRIDLYQLHTIDPAVPLEDSIGELARLQKEGKIRHIGVSNFEVADLEKAAKIVKVVSVQNRYNVADRRSDPVLDYCSQQKIAFIPWAPLAQREKGQENAKIAALEAVAKARNITIHQASLAWLLARSPFMLPIPGTGSIDHLEENVQAAAIKLTADELAKIG